MIGKPLFVTFGLHGSLPPGRAFPPEACGSSEAFVDMDRLLDAARSGPTYLALPGVAGLVGESIRFGGVLDYDLHAWVVMPNHVHLLITPRSEVSKFLRKLKGFTAGQANRLLDRAGQTFWQEESYDRLVRSREEFKRIEAYILNNPVRAGLVRSAEEYQWSGKAG